MFTEVQACQEGVSGVYYDLVATEQKLSKALHKMKTV